MMKAQDSILWDQVKKTVRPLELNGECLTHKEFPPRLKVRRLPMKTISCCLDLHQMTIQEAYEATLKFIEKHCRKGSKEIQIITGKGREGKGIIHSEFPKWIDTKAFQKYICKWQWTNDEGAVKLWLKKNNLF